MGKEGDTAAGLRMGGWPGRVEGYSLSLRGRASTYVCAPACEMVWMICRCAIVYRWSHMEINACVWFFLLLTSHAARVVVHFLPDFTLDLCTAVREKERKLPHPPPQTTPRLRPSLSPLDQLQTEMSFHLSNLLSSPPFGSSHEIIKYAPSLMVSSFPNGTPLPCWKIGRKPACRIRLQRTLLCARTTRIRTAASPLSVPAVKYASNRAVVSLLSRGIEEK